MFPELPPAPRRRLTTVALLFLTASAGTAPPRCLAAQGPTGAPGAAGVAVSGTVRDAATHVSIRDALVWIEGLDRATLSDSTGRYRLTGVPSGPQVLSVRRIGFAAARQPVDVPVSGTITIDLELAANALALPNVIVTADATGRARGELGTASVIERDAIANQTATSLLNILELIPGVAPRPPGLDGVQQIGLRTVPTSTAASQTAGGPTAADIASAGTLIVTDGVPLSNNANLQSTGPRGELQFLSASSAGGGVDLRAIPASTIERVEVIRGIPSARYGDVTQGVILVDTRAGAVAPELTLHYDGNTTEGSLVAGREFRARQALTFSVDLARTEPSPGVTSDQASRLSTQLAHRFAGVRGLATAPDSLTLDTRLSLHAVTDDHPERPDVIPGQASWSRNAGGRLDTRARLTRPGGARYDLTGSFDLGRQRAFVQSSRIRGALPFTDRLTEGRQVGKFIGGPYVSRYDLDGDPRLAYVRFESSLDPAWPLGTQRLRLGGELRREWNAGAGYRFDVEFPPQTTFNGVNGFDRPRAFSATPPLPTSALYADDRLSRLLPHGVPLNVQAGLRLDVLHRGRWWFSKARDAVPQGRLNAEVAPVSWLRLRAGVGQVAKIPSLAQLYPAPQYYDVVNVNWFTNDPAERLAVLSTFIRNATNPDLGFSRARQAEAGVEITPFRDATIAVVAFSDRTRGAVGFRSQPQYLLREHFDFVDSTRGTGRPPTIIEPASFSDTVPILIDRPANNLTLTSSGYEVTASFPQIPALHTRVEVAGSWMRTDLIGRDIDFGSGFSSFQVDGRIARRPYWAGLERTGQRALITYRLIHHQPAWGLVVTATIEQIAKENTRDVAGTDSLAFAGYVTRAGQLVPVPAAQRGDAQYGDLRVPRTGLFTQLSGVAPDWYLSVQVAKSFLGGGRLSFYAFNALDRAGRFDVTGFSSREWPPLRFGGELSLPLGRRSQGGSRGAGP